jgi:hypothetical protein
MDFFGIESLDDDIRKTARAEDMAKSHIPKWQDTPAERQPFSARCLPTAHGLPVGVG